MPLQDHDVLAQRLTHILIKLNQGERLAPSELAQEFGVTLRTIQRDLNERLSFLPFEKVNSKYHLHSSALGKLNLQDMRHFACMAGVQGLFPDLSHEFLRELFDSRVEQAWVVKGPEYEDHSGREAIFAQLGQAITAKHAVSFAYTKAQLDGQTAAAKTYEPAHPYKLVNHGGIWYLAAEHEGKLKAFVLGKIERLLSTTNHFEPRAELLEMLQNEDSIWLNTSKSEVVIKVAKEAAMYFERRKLIGGQVIEKHLEDGGLIVSGQVAHPNQILPIVRYWIPHVRIISPEGLQGEMEQGLREYLG
jgi:predicted DNA-binding transcriptional regulator YafY